MCRPCPLTEKPLWQELETKHFVSGTSSARWDLLRYYSSHFSLAYMSDAFYTSAQCFTKFGHIRQKNLKREHNAKTAGQGAWMFCVCAKVPFTVNVTESWTLESSSVDLPHLYSWQPCCCAAWQIGWKSSMTIDCLWLQVSLFKQSHVPSWLPPLLS